MGDQTGSTLSRRERQIMDILYRHGSATVAAVHAEIPDPPSYSAVRAAMRVLAEKGHVTHARKSHSYVYTPTSPASEVQKAEARRLLDTFFAGSPSQAVAALLEEADALEPDELAELQALIDAARKEGR
ncbi:MAG: BlaI/MecI/CopY family transcriptional regulator [Acidobacteria bacterium]|nr:BlaI/MecI/CopY family transcriptional regulator [Acidobacteriota bacterium]